MEVVDDAAGSDDDGMGKGVWGSGIGGRGAYENSIAKLSLWREDTR